MHRSRTHVTLAGWATVILLQAPQAHAHGSNGERLTLRLDDDTVYIQATPAAALFARFDTNRDGRIERREVRQRREAMVRFFLNSLDLRDRHGARLALVFWDLNPLHSHDQRRGSRFVRVTLRLRLAARSETLWLAYSAGKTAPLSLVAARAPTSAHETQRVVRSRLQTDLVILRLFAAERAAHPDERR